MKTGHRGLSVSILALCVTNCTGSNPPPTDAGIDAALTVDVTSSRDSSTVTDTVIPIRDVSASDAGALDTMVFTGTVPMFVAQGFVGRTTISCDDGRTWVADHSDDEAMRCFSSTPGSDCDHNGHRAMGLATDAGWFVGTWGWGMGNGLRRSRNGVDWERVVLDTSFSGIEAGNGAFVAIGDAPRVSTDHAMTWMTAAPIGFMGHIRGSGFSQGLFIAAGGGGTPEVGDVMLSADGRAWRRPDTIPPECGVGIAPGRIAGGGGVTVIGHDGGRICRSADAGRTWTSAQIDGATIASTVLYTGTEFVTWGTRSGTPTRFHSANGTTWLFDATQTRAPGGAITPGPSLDPVGRSDSGTYVAVRGGWQNWYDRQVFYRSTDGITWDALAPTAFHGSHPMRAIRWAMGARSAACP